MSDRIHIPILRLGEPYVSLRLRTLRHIATGEPVAEVSQANAGLIRRDLLRAPEAQRQLASLTAVELHELCGRAATQFAEGVLPLGDGVQTPDDYVWQLSATTGLPHTLCRHNSDKVCGALRQMDEIVEGLTRGADNELLDRGWSDRGGHMLSYLRQSDVLGAVLPNNSPGVHTLWLPALAIKVPLALRPGSEEPWTPYRVAQAFIAAGCPPSAFSLYPSDYSGATELLLGCGRAILFGGEATVAAWRADPRIEIHGPGSSKILFDRDAVAEWTRHLPWLVDSVAENGGRSCINASAVWVPAHGRELAAGLARELNTIEPRPLTDADARLAAFANAQSARQLSAMIDRQLLTPGAEDVTATLRGDAERVVEVGGCTFLRPTVIRCDDPGHPLANAEFLFPFVAVVEVPQAEFADRIGDSLVVTAVTEERNLMQTLMDCPHIDRLNLGPIKTNQISWDQPHEGNLFEFLYRQRSFNLAQPA